MPAEITFSNLITQVLNGLVLGGLFILISIGLSVIFGMVGIVNFAHGALFTLGGYFAFTFISPLGFWPTLILAPFVVALIGMALESSMLRPLYGKHHLFGLLLTFGVAYFVEEAVKIIWGKPGRSIAPPEFLLGLVNLGFVSYPLYRLFVLVSTFILVIALAIFLEKTPYGAIIRAGSRDGEMVTILGIRLPRIFTFVFGIGAFLAGIAGVLGGPIWGVSPTVGMSVLMPAFVIVVVGGLGSFWGAVIGGILIGELTCLSIVFWPPISEVIMYVFMAIILLVKPRGFMGEVWEEFE